MVMCRHSCVLFRMVMAMATAKAMQAAHTVQKIRTGLRCMLEEEEGLSL